MMRKYIDLTSILYAISQRYWLFSPEEYFSRNDQSWGDDLSYDYWHFSSLKLKVVLSFSVICYLFVSEIFCIFGGRGVQNHLAIFNQSSTTLFYNKRFKFVWMKAQKNIQIKTSNIWSTNRLYMFGISKHLFCRNSQEIIYVSNY